MRLAAIEYDGVTAGESRRSEHRTLAPADPATNRSDEKSVVEHEYQPKAPAMTMPAEWAHRESDHMQTRTHTNRSFNQGAAQRRRIRRNTAGAWLYCRTNGCTTYLQPDAGGHSASCPICGASRMLS